METLTINVTNDQILLTVIRSVPYPAQITNIDTTNEGCVCFKYRRAEYKVTKDYQVYEIEGACAIGSEITTILRALFLKDLIIGELNED